MKSIELNSQPVVPDPFKSMVQEVCRRLPPLWPLQDFVAVNPLLGYRDQPFLTAARLIQRVGHAEILMSADYFCARLNTAEVSAGDVRRAVAHMRPDPLFRSLAGVWPDSVGALLELLRRQPRTIAAGQFKTYSEFFDQTENSGWSPFVVDEISKWCAAYFDRGQSVWRMPWHQSNLFAAWQAAARLDANPEWQGVAGFRAWVAELPADPWLVISLALSELEIPGPCQPTFLHRALLSIAGWSSYLQGQLRAKGPDIHAGDTLVALLAIRLAYDMALHQLLAGKGQPRELWPQYLRGLPVSSSDIPEELAVRYLAQQTLECAYQRQLFRQIATRPAAPAARARKKLQAVFCIDVRSEIMRRQLEQQTDAIATFGFAGFFGMPISYQPAGQAAGQAQCPVLLQPKYHIADRPRYGWQGAAWRSACRAAWNDLKTSPASGFAFVETSGLAFGYKLLRDGFGRARAGRQNPAGKTLPLQIDVGADRPKPPENAADIACSGIALADQIQLAGGALRNLGLTRDFAPWVLFCGHGTSTVNNPYTAALDCGACGGHGGAVNARVAAAILNQPAVRQALVSQGIHIPADTIFLAGWHNTTTDEITLFEADLPRSSREGELTEIKDWLAAAGQSARWERARALHLETMAPSRLLAQFQARARDWSQVRPEWGLAGNAALIAAPRERTQGLNLGGRVFLHDYRTDLDPDKKVLEMILLAPVVVASWINLQYYASTTDNRHFGSGNKVLHNVVGTFGIWQGNGGDLQTGLPLQSLHDGSDWYHEPLRLSVLIEAPRVDLCHLIEAHPALRELVENQWILLFAMEAEGKAIYRYADGRFIGESLTA